MGQGSRQGGPPQGLAMVKTVTPASASKLEQIGTELKQDLRNLVQTEVQQLSSQSSASSQHDSSFQQLECGVHELKLQNAKFEDWFAKFGSRVSEQTSRIDDLASTVKAQGKDIHGLRSDVENSVHTAISRMQGDMSAQLAAQLSGQMEQIQALLSDKKPRTS